MPELHIITGSNGAGKSTVGFTYIPSEILQDHTIFDGDKLFGDKRAELLKDKQMTFKEARNLANEWLIGHFQKLVNIALETKDHFVYEGHFSEDASWDIIKRFKKSGYTIYLTFFGLKDQDLSQMRVIERHQSGGHYVQPAEIDRNFEGNLIMLDKYYELLDNIRIVDTSELEHRILVVLSPEGVTQCVTPNMLPDWFIKYLPRIRKRAFHGN